MMTYKVFLIILATDKSYDFRGLPWLELRHSALVWKETHPLPVKTTSTCVNFTVKTLSTGVKTTSTCR